MSVKQKVSIWIPLQVQNGIDLILKSSQKDDFSCELFVLIISYVCLDLNRGSTYNTIEVGDYHEYLF